MTKKKNTIIAAVIVGCLVLSCPAVKDKIDPFLERLKKGYSSAEIPRDENGYVKVIRVIDGDTLVITGGSRVRLIGIDTPESSPNERAIRYAKKNAKDINDVIVMGKKASDFTRGLVDGENVRLELDVERYDIYDRLLAYVYLENDTFVNEEIVRQGHAHLLTISPNVKHSKLFRKAFNDAQQNGRGLWSGD
jgi:micrococcal nuclease